MDQRGTEEYSGVQLKTAVQAAAAVAPLLDEMKCCCCCCFEGKKQWIQPSVGSAWRTSRNSLLSIRTSST